MVIFLLSIFRYIWQIFKNKKLKIYTNNFEKKLNEIEKFHSSNFDKFVNIIKDIEKLK